MEEQKLKELLLESRQNDYEIPPGLEVLSFSKELLLHIGSTDSELRDSLIYPVLSRWILKGVFSAEEKLEITRTLLGKDYLLHGLGKEEDDSVFKRAFSVLQLAVLVYLHRKEPFLPLDLLTEIKDQMFCLLEEEVDLRGYVSGKGWAHCVAHSADLLDELVLCEEFGKAELEAVLPLVSRRIYQTKSVFIHEEDERLLTAIFSLFSRQVFSEEKIKDWVSSFRRNEKTFENLPESYYRMLNCKNFLRAMFFRIKKEEKYTSLLPFIEEILAGLVVR